MRSVLIITSLLILNADVIRAACHFGCYNNVCNTGNGYCDCKNGYSGRRCDTCIYCMNSDCDEDGFCTTGCYWLNYYGNRCNQQCPVHCIVLQNQPICDRTNGNCIKGCYKGYTGSRCNECASKYYLQSPGKCISCKHNCKSCTGWNTCVACVNYNYFGPYCQTACSPGCASGRCRKSDGACIGECKIGYKRNKCDECSDQYYKDKRECNPCPIHCTTCSSENSCEVCVPGYFGQTCQYICSNGCTTLECYKNSGSCTCKKGFKNYNCNQCVDEKYGNNCDIDCPNTCTKCDSGDRCDSCKTGSYGTVCELSCPTGCRGGCDKSSGTCTDCQDGYSGNRCCAQSNNCELCSSDTQCSQCKSGVYGTLCQTSCPENCDGKCNIISGECFSCQPRYYGSRCESVCSENCKSCEANGICDSCNVGFYGLHCNTACPANCISCTDETSCDSCTEGFYGSTCNDNCLDHCASCSNSEFCARCKQGFFGTQCTGKCQDNCVSCSSATICDLCKEGYTGYTCNNNCSKNCKSCFINSYSSCTSCARGKYTSGSNYYLNQLHLYCDRDCSKNCLNGFCNDHTAVCEDGCLIGYTGDGCFCPENCRSGTCHSRYACQYTNCVEGFSGTNCACTSELCADSTCTSCINNSAYLSGGLCCKCPGTCKDNMCSGANMCLNGCVDGFYGYGCQDRCLERDIQCLTCTTTSCRQCLPGFFPSTANGQCKMCSINCLDAICSAFNGTCLNGCSRGYWGTDCSNPCRQYCKECDRYDGTCSVCSNGRYGRDCSRICNDQCLKSGNLNICNMDDGSCRLGCSNNQTHGAMCHLACNKTCSEQECSWQTGICTKGCAIGYHGEWCEKKCSDNCLDSPGSSSCASKDGTCHVGCQNGYFMNDCQTSCGANCINETCDRESGDCIHGCAVGFEGNDCAKALGQSGGDNTGVIAGAAAGGVVFLLVIAAVVVVVLFMRRRRGKKADNTDFSPAEKGGHTNIAMDDVGPVYTNSSAAVNMNSEPSKPSKPSRSGNKNQTPHISLTNSLDLESDTDTMATVEARRSRDLAATANQPLRAGNELALPIIAAGRESPDGEEYADQPIRGGDDGDTYYNAGAIRRVAVDKLADYVAKKSDDDFKQEFGSFPKGLVKPYGVSQMPGNVKRNRYNKVYPYDENRVKLQNATCDYINASYIDGFERKNEYTAALGPTEDTTDHFATFWSMIWQQKVEKLVMLTKLQEGPKMKCHQYWPHPGEGETYGDVKVTCMAEDTYAEYTVRTLSATKDREKRVIYHLHYTGWPDRGVPDDVTGLIEFRNKVLRVKATLDGPVLVHCSAGVGRTGTYIALDYLTNEGDETESVDVFELVSSLRQQRIWMVQAEEQYVYLHDAVVHTLTYDSRPIHSDTFQEHIKSLTSAKLKRMYSHLKSGHSRKEEDEVKAVAKNKTYKNKNNPAADIPGDRYRPRIHLGRTQGECDYINAVYLNSFRFRNHYIVAQTPLSSAVGDFLTLLFQEHIPCIVDMQPHHKPQKNIGEYLPADNQEVTHGDFAIRSMKVKSNNQFTMRRLIITRNSTQGPEERIFHHFQCVAWQDSAPTPPSHADFVNFVREVEAKSKEDFEDAKILIHCLTGSGRSCLFPAVSVMLQKMESEQEVSVVNTVRQIQSRRPSAIPDKEQYLFCHECIRAFLDSFDTYSNFAMR